MKFRISWVAVLVMASALTVQAGDDDDDEFVDGVVKYKFGGVATLEATPAAACQDGVKELAKNGNKQTYVSVKDGPADGAESCMLKGTDGKTWEQTNLVTKVLVCPATTSVRSVDNSGLFKTERCHCDDDVAGCPATTKRPAIKLVLPAPSNYCDKSKFKKSDPGRKPSSVGEARMQSMSQAAAMRKEANDHADKHGMLWHYNQEKDKVRGNKGRFPTYGDADLFPGRPNDVNIGTLCGTREQDFAAANAAAGLKCTPDGYVWHHHQNLGRMLLVKNDVHKEEDHTGSVGIWQQAFCVESKNPKDPKPNPAQCGYKSEYNGGRPPKDPPCKNP